MPAFCQGISHLSSPPLFPLPVPERHVPWIWDAVYDHEAAELMLVAASQQACDFNITSWLALFNMYPQFHSILGDGDRNNIYVKPLERNSDGKKMDISRHYSNNRYKNVPIKLQCIFLKDDIEVARANASRPDVGILGGLSAILITCPVPETYPSTWNAVQLERRIAMAELKVFNLSNPGDFVNNYITPSFPVCNLRKMKLKKKLYDLSICTAVMGGTREEFVEWIEYHLQQGYDRLTFA